MDRPKRLAACELVKNSALTLSVSRFWVSVIVLFFILIFEDAYLQMLYLYLRILKINEWQFFIFDKNNSHEHPQLGSW
jgi:hypothetical protein